MCLIIVSPADKEIPREILKSAFDVNDDGYGMMRLSRRTGEPFVIKGVGDFEKFYRIYKRDFVGFDTALHFRWKTHGEVCVEQSHPYEVTEGVYLMHNGVIDTTITDESKSDTWHYGQVIRKFIEEGYLRDPSFREMIEMSLGYGNKIVILDKYGFELFNSNQGVVYDGSWYSNATMWNAPAELLPKKAVTTATSVEEAITETVDPSVDFEEKYIQWWKNAVNEGTRDLSDAPPDVQDVLKDIFDDMPPTNGTVMLAPAKPIMQNYMPTSFIEPKVPDTLDGWANLSKNEIRHILYNDPDIGADVIFEMIQGA